MKSLRFLIRSGVNTAIDYMGFSIPLPSTVFFVSFPYSLLHSSDGYDSSHVLHFCSMNPEIFVIIGGVKLQDRNFEEMPMQWGLWTHGQVEGPGSFLGILFGALKWLVLSLCIFKEDYEIFVPKGVL